MRIQVSILLFSLLSAAFMFAQTNSNTTTTGENSGTQGEYNSFYGKSSGENTSGNNNSFFGAYAGHLNTIGKNNTAVGLNASRENNIGNHNTSIGINAGRYLKNGSNNFFGGAAAGADKTSGNLNTFVGAYAGRANAAGANNTYIGADAGRNSIGHKNVFIGYGAGHNEQGDQKLYINNSTTSLPLIYGDFSADYVNFNGNVGIGIRNNTPDAKLAVNGMIRAKEIKVNLLNWPDYVFEDTYTLPTLEEVAVHIRDKGHLINVPSAKEVAKNGVALGEMNAKLLEKIEELTLYTLAQQKEIDELKEVKASNKELEARLARVEALLMKQ